jgi:Tfp pilus assembly protein PilO
MKGLEKQQTVLLAIVLLLMAGIGVFRYLPLLRQRQALDATMEQNSQTLEQIHTQGARLGDLSRQLEQMQSQANSFDVKIPAGRSFADLWRQIADLMNQYRLTDQLVQPGKPTESDRLGAIPLTLACTGSMQDMYAFFRAIEQWDRLIRFEQIDLVNDSDFGGSVKLNARAQLYYQPEDKKG